MRIDFPQLPNLPDGKTTVFPVDLTLAGTTTYPNTSITGKATTNESPYNAFDVRRCRGLTVQCSSYGVTTPGTIQLLVSLDNKSHVPLYWYDPASGTWINTTTLPANGTATVPLATIIIVDIPWFAWMKISLTAAVAGNAWLTVYKRD